MRRDRRPETRRMRSTKVALLKIPKDSLCVCACRTTQSTVESMMTRMMSTAFMGSRNRPLSRSPYGADSMTTCYRNFQNCKFWWISFACFGPSVRCHFLHNFPTWSVTFTGKALATKCIFQNYSQLLDICTRQVFKNRRGTFCTKCRCLKKKKNLWETSKIKENKG